MPVSVSENASKRESAPGVPLPRLWPGKRVKQRTAYLDAGAAAEMKSEP